MLNRERHPHGLRLYKGVQFANMQNTNIDFPGVPSEMIMTSINDFFSQYIYKIEKDVTFTKSNKNAITVKGAFKSLRLINYISFDNEISESGVTFAKVLDVIYNTEDSVIIEFAVDVWLTFSKERTSKYTQFRGNLSRSHHNSIIIEDYEVESYNRKGNYEKYLYGTVQAEQFKPNKQIKDIDIIVITTSTDVAFSDKNSKRATMMTHKTGLISPFSHYVFFYNKKTNEYIQNIKNGAGDAVSLIYHNFEDVIHYLQTNEAFVGSIVDTTVFPYMSFLMDFNSQGALELYNPKSVSTILNRVINNVSSYMHVANYGGIMGLSGLRLAKLNDEITQNYTVMMNFGMFGGYELKQNNRVGYRNGSYKSKTLFNDTLDKFDKKYRNFMIDGKPNKLLCYPYNYFTIYNSKGDKLVIDPALLPVNGNGIPRLSLELITTIGTSATYSLSILDYKKGKVERKSARAQCDPLQEQVNDIYDEKDMNFRFNDRIDLEENLISEYNIKIPTLTDKMAEYVQASKNSVAYSQKTNKQLGYLQTGMNAATALGSGNLGGAVIGGLMGVVNTEVSSRVEKGSEAMKKADLRNLNPAVSGSATSDNSHFQLENGLYKLMHITTEQSQMKEINRYHNEFGFTQNRSIELDGTKFYELTKYRNIDLTHREFTFIKFNNVDVNSSIMPLVYSELLEELLEEGITLYNAADKNIKYTYNNSVMDLEINQTYNDKEVTNEWKLFKMVWRSTKCNCT